MTTQRVKKLLEGRDMQGLRNKAGAALELLESMMDARGHLVTAHHGGGLCPHFCSAARGVLGMEFPGSADATAESGRGKAQSTDAGRDLVESARGRQALEALQGLMGSYGHFGHDPDQPCPEACRAARLVLGLDFAQAGELGNPHPFDLSKLSGAELGDLRALLGLSRAPAASTVAGGPPLESIQVDTTQAQASMAALRQEMAEATAQVKKLSDALDSLERRRARADATLPLAYTRLGDVERGEPRDPKVMQALDLFDRVERGSLPREQASILLEFMGFRSALAFKFLTPRQPSAEWVMKAEKAWGDADQTERDDASRLAEMFWDARDEKRDPALLVLQDLPATVRVGWLVVAREARSWIRDIAPEESPAPVDPDPLSRG